VCENDYLEVAKWLFQIKPTIDVSIDSEKIFRTVCENDYLEMAQWLLQIKPTIDISAENEYAFRMACKIGHLGVARWLVQLKPDIYSIELNYGKIIPTIMNGLNIIGTVEKSEHILCSICIETNSEIETKCKHSFCKGCIVKWINKKKNTCPYCRQLMGNDFNKIQYLS
jgi:hypothetical protein